MCWVRAGLGVSSGASSALCFMISAADAATALRAGECAVRGSAGKGWHPCKLPAAAAAAAAAAGLTAAAAAAAADQGNSRSSACKSRLPSRTGVRIGLLHRSALLPRRVPIFVTLPRTPGRCSLPALCVSALPQFCALVRCPVCGRENADTPSSPRDAVHALAAMEPAAAPIASKQSAPKAMKLSGGGG